MSEQVKRIYGPYQAVATKIEDGDTITVLIDCGFAISFGPIRARLYGINAPEMSTDAGKAARVYLQSILPIPSPVVVTSMGFDKYARIDAKVAYGMIDLAEAMLSSGHAVPYVV